jgi:hypothetical protein
MKPVCMTTIPFIIVFSLASPIMAEGISASTVVDVEGYYSFPNQQGYESSGFAPINYAPVLASSSNERELGTSWGGVDLKGTIDRQYVFPMLQCPGALTKDNNLALDLEGELSPVSLNANISATLTPIAFLKFSAGVGTGTGWTIDALGLDVVGLGINDKGTIETQNFGGLILRLWASATFQFDLAAVMPGEWNHIILLASPKLEYMDYTAAANDQPWMWEDDSGMDYNGWQLYGSYFLGYQMPTALTMVGFLAEPETYLFSAAEMSPMTKTDGSHGWGSDFTYWTISMVFDFKLNDTTSLAILPGIKNGIKWTDGTTRLADFTQCQYEDSYWYFYRLAFDLTLKL